MKMFSLIASFGAAISLAMAAGAASADDGLYYDEITISALDRAPAEIDLNVVDAAVAPNIGYYHQYAVLDADNMFDRTTETVYVNFDDAPANRSGPSPSSMNVMTVFNDTGLVDARGSPPTVVDHANDDTQVTGSNAGI